MTAEETQTLAQFRREVQLQIDGLKTSLAEQDKRNTQRFEAGDRSVQAALVAAKEAVQAAMVAAKEAVEKAELATGRAFASMAEKLDETRDLQTGQLSVLSDRLGKIEGHSSGLNAGWGYLVGAFGVGAVIFSGIMALAR